MIPAYLCFVPLLSFYTALKGLPSYILRIHLPSNFLGCRKLLSIKCQNRMRRNQLLDDQLYSQQYNKRLKGGILCTGSHLIRLETMYPKISLQALTGYYSCKLQWKRFRCYTSVQPWKAATDGRVNNQSFFKMYLSWILENNAHFTCIKPYISRQQYF